MVRDKGKSPVEMRISLESTAVSRRSLLEIANIVVDEANDMLLCEYGPTAKLYDKPIVSSPICRSGWDHKSAALIRLDALYEYAAKTGNMSEVQRIGEEIAQLVDQL